VSIVRTAAKTALGARQVVKDLGRLQQIAQVLVRHGLGWLVANLDLPGLGLLRKDEGRRGFSPEDMVAVLRELGPTFVKLGQMLSTRSDILPAAYTEALQELQDDVGPFPWEEVEAQIRQALGASPDELFAHFEREPVATASISQVHRARLPTGEEVAVKVRRPGVRERLETDLSLLLFLARRAEAQFPEVRLMDLTGILSELRRAVVEETDFRVEAAHLQRFAENFAGNDHIVIPAVFRSHTAEQVLTMEWVDGVRIARAREAGFDMRTVGQRYLAAAFQMLLEDGLFHGDLHPGNVLVLEDNRLALLDFGLVGRLTEEMRENLVTIFFAIQRKDFRTIARVYWELAIRTDHVDYAAWEADLQGLFERQVMGRSLAELQIEEFARQMAEIALRHKVRMPSSYTLFFKALLTAQGLARQLVPEVDPLEEMLPYVQRMARELYSRERIQEEIFYQLTSLRYTVRRLPLILGQAVTDLQEGRLRLKLQTESSPDERVARDERADRLALAIVFLGAVVSASLALHAPAPLLLGLPWPATLGYGFAGIVVALFVRAVRRSRREADPSHRRRSRT